LPGRQPVASREFDLWSRNEAGHVLSESGPVRGTRRWAASAAVTHGAQSCDISACPNASQSSGKRHICCGVACLDTRLAFAYATSRRAVRIRRGRGSFCTRQCSKSSRSIFAVSRVTKLRLFAGCAWCCCWPAQQQPAPSIVQCSMRAAVLLARLCVLASQSLHKRYKQPRQSLTCVGSPYQPQLLNLGLIQGLDRQHCRLHR
jgi:hypothetical protein